MARVRKNESRMQSAVSHTTQDKTSTSFNVIDEEEEGCRNWRRNVSALSSSGWAIGFFLRGSLKPIRWFDLESEKEHTVVFGCCASPGSDHWKLQLSYSPTSLHSNLPWHLSSASAQDLFRLGHPRVWVLSHQARRITCQKCCINSQAIWTSSQFSSQVFFLFV